MAARRLHVPSVVLEVVAGILIGPAVLAPDTSAAGSKTAESPVHNDRTGHIVLEVVLLGYFMT
jgi:Kef-type K+ transport system membrane component KefB